MSRRAFQGKSNKQTNKQTTEKIHKLAASVADVSGWRVGSALGVGLLSGRLKSLHLERILLFRPNDCADVHTLDEDCATEQRGEGTKKF